MLKFAASTKDRLFAHSSAFTANRKASFCQKQRQMFSHIGLMASAPWQAFSGRMCKETSLKCWKKEWTVTHLLFSEGKSMQKAHVLAESKAQAATAADCAALAHGWWPITKMLSTKDGGGGRYEDATSCDGGSFHTTLQYYYCKFTLNAHCRVHYPEAGASRTLKVSVLLVIEAIVHHYFCLRCFSLLLSSLAVWMEMFSRT